MIFTSNKSYGEWGEIFQDHVIAAAILDRILYHCTTINIKGESYRLKERGKIGILTTHRCEELQGGFEKRYVFSSPTSAASSLSY